LDAGSVVASFTNDSPASAFVGVAGNGEVMQGEMETDASFSVRLALEYRKQLRL
jgi:hypothetical protein